jgi:PhnB protein
VQLNPNLVFNGNAEEVLHHYKAALGGEIQIMRFRESPAAGEVPSDYADKVIYGTLVSPAGMVNAMDAPPSRGGGESGDNFILGVQTDDAAQTDAIFSKLAEGGSITMPLDKTFWSPRFGMCTDKFGIKWMVNLAGAPGQ